MKKPAIVLTLLLFFGISLYQIYFIRAVYISNADELKNVVLVGIDDYAQTHETISYDEVKKFIEIADGKELAMHPIDSLAGIAITNIVLLFSCLVYFLLSGRIFNKENQQGPSAWTD